MGTVQVSELCTNCVTCIFFIFQVYKYETRIFSKNNTLNSE